MSRFGLACWLSLGLHTVALAGGDLLIFHDSALQVSRGQTRVALLFQPSRPERTQAPVEPEPTQVITQVEPQDRTLKESVEVASIPPLEEGVEEVPPSYSSNLPPAYPREAFLKGVQGVVWILAEVDRRGHPSQVRVERSSGSGLLDAAAAEAVAGWRFVPARRAGISVASRVRIPIHFRIITERR